MSQRKPVYKRILLKLSGEALAGTQGFGIDATVVGQIADEIADVYKLGVGIAIVIGGGNIVRGISAEAQGIDRVTGDNMGMLATVINALAVQDALEKREIHTRVMTAIDMVSLAEPYIRRKAKRHMEKDRVIILAAGTGHPYFTTDTAASLRAIEMGADAILKATKVDGIFDKDPKKFKDAKKFDTLTYIEILRSRLEVMDATATSLCMDNNMTIVVFNLLKHGNIKRIVLGDPIGTIVTGE